MIKLYTLNPSRSASQTVTPRDGLRRLTLCRPMTPFPNMPTSDFGGVIECAVYEDFHTVLRAHRVPDIAAFLETYGGDRWIARPSVVVEGVPGDPARGIKLTSLFKRLAPMSREKFLEHYPQVHAPLVKKTPELLRYEQNYIVGGAEATFDLRFDAIAELWWVDRDTAIRSWSSPEIQVDQFRDCENFIDASSSVSVFGTEELVV